MGLLVALGRQTCLKGNEPVQNGFNTGPLHDYPEQQAEKIA